MKLRIEMSWGVEKGGFWRKLLYHARGSRHHRRRVERRCLCLAPRQCAMQRCEYCTACEGKRRYKRAAKDCFLIRHLSLALFFFANSGSVPPPWQRLPHKKTYVNAKTPNAMAATMWIGMPSPVDWPSVFLSVSTCDWSRFTSACNSEWLFSLRPLLAPPLPAPPTARAPAFLVAANAAPAEAAVAPPAAKAACFAFSAEPPSVLEDAFCAAATGFWNPLETVAYFCKVAKEQCCASVHYPKQCARFFERVHSHSRRCH